MQVRGGRESAGWGVPDILHGCKASEWQEVWMTAQSQTLAILLVARPLKEEVLGGYRVCEIGQPV